MRKRRPGGVGAEAAAAEGETGVEAGSLALCSQASSLCEGEEAHPRLEEMGLSSQSHLRLPGGKVTFSWELEGQEQSC